MSICPGFFSVIKSKDNEVRGYLIGSTHTADNIRYAKFVETTYPVIDTVTHIAVETISPMSSFNKLHTDCHKDILNLIKKLSDKELIKISKCLKNRELSSSNSVGEKSATSDKVAVNSSFLNQPMNEVSSNLGFSPPLYEKLQKSTGKRSRPEANENISMANKRRKLSTTSCKEIQVDRDKEAEFICRNLMNQNNKEFFAEEDFFIKYIKENPQKNIKLVSLEDSNDVANFVHRAYIKNTSKLIDNICSSKTSEETDEFLNKEEVSILGEAWSNNNYQICDQLKHRNKNDGILSYIDNRSINQVNSMDSILHNLKALSLFCVGILHLHGSNGIIAGLESKGWIVQPVHMED